MKISGWQVSYRLFFAASLVLLMFAACSAYRQEPVLAVPSPTPQPTDEDIIYLYYNERPPYLITTENGVEGLTGSPTTLVFEKSQIPFQWKQTPSKRQIYILQQNTGRACLPGWFKTTEREAYARFTLPVYQEKPQIALARADNDRIPSSGTVEDFFSNPQLNLLVKDGYSYGEFLDQRIAELDPVRIETTVENSGMLKMIHARHADYFFIAPEEAEGLINASGFDMHDFKTIHFTDIVAGEKRYILCNFQIDDATIERLNEAIRQYVEIAPE